MLNRVREAVSADRRRYKDSEFNLDLSYVTPRIIGTPYRLVPIHSVTYWFGLHLTVFSATLC